VAFIDASNENTTPFGSQLSCLNSEINLATRFDLEETLKHMFGWFQALMPKEGRFFQLFEKHATIVVG
jgi:hypothetical protein